MWLNVGSRCRTCPFHGRRFDAPTTQGGDGIDFDDEKLMAIGKRIFTMTYAYIPPIGISRKDDWLPDRCMEVPRVVEGVELLADVESLLPSCYTLRGWDETGIPTADKLN